MKARTLQILSLIIAVCAGILAMADQITPIVAINDTLAMWWPVILVVATIISRVAALIADHIKKVPLWILLFATLQFTGCAGSGEGGRWTPADTAASMSVINSGIDGYNRIRNPEYFYRPNPAIVPVVPLVP